MRHHTGEIDVAVVGGGLAGLAAAALLAQNGQRVVAVACRCALRKRRQAFGVQVLRGALVSEVLHDGAVHGCTIRFIRRPPTSRRGMAR